MAGDKKDPFPAMHLSSTEAISGTMFLPFYMSFVPLLVSAGFTWLNREPDAYELNVSVFCVNFLAVAVIYQRFLLSSFKHISKTFWLFVQTCILGTILYYCLNFGTAFLYKQLNIELINTNNDTITTLLEEHFLVMALCVCLLAPIVEECICRGLFFGSIRPKNRYFAYFVSIVVFAFLHVWQFYWEYSIENLLLVAATYIPAGIALSWAYEKSGTIWCPIAIHAVVNFVTSYTTIYGSILNLLRS